MSEQSNAETFPEELSDAKAALHGAALAVLLHLDHPAVQDAAEAYATRVVSSYDEDVATALEAYEDEVRAQAQQFAAEFRHSLYARALRQLGQQTWRGAECPLQDDEQWAELQRPFTFHEVQLAGLEIDPVTRGGIAHPVFDVEALRSRLDEVVGPGGWQLKFDLRGKSPVKATLTIAGTSRDGFGLDSDLSTACGEAVRAAARLFGIGRGLHGEAVVAVEVDDQGTITNAGAIRQQMVEAGVIEE